MFFMENRPMDTLNRKANAPKIIDTINFNGKYVDAAYFKAKVITVSAISAFFASFAAFLFVVFF